MGPASQQSGWRGRLSALVLPNGASGAGKVGSTLETSSKSGYRSKMTRSRSGVCSRPKSQLILADFYSEMGGTCSASRFVPKTLGRSAKVAARSAGRPTSMPRA